MIGLFIRKSFYDGVDNFFQSIVYNLITTAILWFAIFFLGTRIDVQSENGLTLYFELIFATTIVLSVFVFGLAGISYNWSFYERSWGKGFVSALSKHGGHIVFFWAIMIFVGFCSLMLIPAFLPGQNLFGYFIAFIQIWINLIILMAMQYYIPLSMLAEDKGPMEVLKKCFILMFKNKAFTLVVFLKTIYQFALSLVTAFVFPGLSMISLSHMDAAKLLCLKDQGDDKIQEEEEALGNRTLKTIFKPWKYKD